jgi:hypothetical protein
VGGVRRLLTRIAYLIDLAQGEDAGRAMVPLAAQTSVPYATVCKVDQAYADLGRAIEAWKATL